MGTWISEFSSDIQGFVLQVALRELSSVEFKTAIPYGSKGPNNRALGPKYHNVNGTWALKPYIGVLGPLGISRLQDLLWRRKQTCMTGGYASCQYEGSGFRVTLIPLNTVGAAKWPTFVRLACVAWQSLGPLNL